jgi:hypothetical protein
MSVWIVSYDLRAPGRNYEPLYKALKSVAFAKMLESFWLIEAEGPATRIRDALKVHLDRNDGIAVIEFKETADWALSGINKPSMDWIKLKRP